MTRLEALQAAQTLEDVARILGFTPSGLSFILYKISNTAKYSCFDIPKRDGSKRHIKAPEQRLRLAQRRLANLLYDCLADIEKDSPNRRSLSHGFAKGRSILTNATLHKGRRYVLNLDLEDFFPSFNFGRVRGFFIKDRYFGLQEKVATVVAQIACHDNELPQGSPCSPVISNLIGHVLDVRLARLAKKYKCTYSRYADDITFSTGRREFPPELATPGASILPEWKLGEELISKIQASGFRINDKKTRMQFRGSRQMTTGLLVNEKVNVTPEYYKSVRAMCHRLFTTGAFHIKIPATLAGLSPEATDTITSTSVSSLGGRLAHIDFVRNGLQRKRRTEVDGKNEQAKRAQKTRTAITGFRKVYSDFLFYKNFIALDKPLIIPEGKTDTIYLQCAIQQSPDFQPALGYFDGKNFINTLRFMTYSNTVHEYLHLGGGFGDLIPFINTYKKRAQLFVHKPMAYPVILLVDNDDGGKKIFGPAKDHGVKPDITLSSTDSFYYLALNLYIIKTPELGIDSRSCMEDLFLSSAKSVVIEGKTFDPSKNHDDSITYGKFVFAENVVKQNADTIDFSMFDPLLDRIQAVLADYKTRNVSTMAAFEN